MTASDAKFGSFPNQLIPVIDVMEWVMECRNADLGRGSVVAPQQYQYDGLTASPREKFSYLE